MFGRRAACMLALCFVPLAALSSTTGQAGTARPVFQQGACDLPGLSPEIAPRVQCGTVSVPHSYGQPGSGVFKLAVVVVKSVQQPALPDPVVYISGGPGSPLTKYTENQVRHPYAPDRDLILVDQRGVGRSEPSLCPDVAGELVGAAFAVADSITAETQGRRRALFMACRDTAKAQGIDLDDFGTNVTVEDFEQVRQALGVARWNVVGNSYGTTVAMTLMARHPEAIRSAVLDSVYPPDLVLPPWSARVAAARTAFFGMCEQDPACAAAFPDLAGQYRQTLERLSHTPMTVAVPAAMHQPNNQTPLTASLFEMVVALRLYYPENYPDLPRLIATIHDGKAEDFAAALAAVLLGAADLNNPAHIAVECRDRPRLREPVGAGADPLDRIVDHGICTGWAELGPSPVIPTGTNIPTLVLAGQFDPNASPPLSHQVAELIVFAGDTSGVLSGSYDPGVAGGVRWNRTPELPVTAAMSDGFPGLAGRVRISSFAEAGGRMFAAIGQQVWVRQDGPSPSWKLLYTNPAPAFSETGLRGLTAVREQGGEALLAAVEGWKSRIVRINPMTGAETTDLDLAGFLDDAWHTRVSYVIGAYNDMARLALPGGGEALLIGLEAFIPPAAPRPPGHKVLDVNHGLEAGAWFLIRHPGGRYELHEVPPTSAPTGSDLVAVRVARASPFPGQAATTYLGGYDANDSSAHHTAWIVQGRAGIGGR